MPTHTFFNLSNEKKQTLIDAIKKEFSRVPLYNASISNIVKSASIPRGSFYQYFENKDDAFFFLLNELVMNIKHDFMSLLRKNDGDLFDTLINFYQNIIEEEEDVQFLKNAFLNMTYKIEHTLSMIFSDHESNGTFREMIFMIDTTRLNITNEKEFYHLLQIVSTITFRNVVEKFAKELPNQKALENYIMEINLVKNGLTLH